MRRVVLLFVFVPLAVLALLSSLASARPTASNTWAGVWNSDFGPLTLDAGGSGSYAGSSPGTVSGSVVGDVDKGTWNQPGSPPKSGTFEFTLSPDGQSFTGTWAYASGGCGSICGWDGTCQSGACLKNGQVATTTPTPTATTPAARGCSGRVVQGASALKEVRVVAVKPDVAYHCEGEPSDVWHELEKDTVLKQGDEISTDPDGSVTLAFADNSTVVMSNTTQLKIASFFAEGGIVRTQILLKMGEVAATVNKSETTKSDFKIKSPTGVSSVRGTVFTVFYDPGSNTTVTSVQRGVVTVAPTKPGLPTVDVGVGKEVEVTSTAISPLVPIGKAGARGGVNLMKARDLVLKIIARTNGPCALTLPRTNAFSVKPSAGGWLVSIRAIAGKAKGWSTWTVTGATVRPLNQLARTIAGGCQTVKQPPPPAQSKARAGHYTGSTDQGKSITFDVTANRSNVTNLNVAGSVTCTDSSQWTWTVTSTSPNPISPRLAFSHSHSGPLTISDTSITNITASSMLAGTLTTAGSASGTFVITHITWAQNGKHFDCSGTTTNWTAKISG